MWVEQTDGSECPLLPHEGPEFLAGEATEGSAVRAKADAGTGTGTGTGQ